MNGMFLAAVAYPRYVDNGICTFDYFWSDWNVASLIEKTPALIEKTPALRASMSQPCGAIVTNQDKCAQRKLIKI